MWIRSQYHMESRNEAIKKKLLDSKWKGICVWKRRLKRWMCQVFCAIQFCYNWIAYLWILIKSSILIQTHTNPHTLERICYSLLLFFLFWRFMTHFSFVYFKCSPSWIGALKCISVHAAATITTKTTANRTEGKKTKGEKEKLKNGSASSVK